MPEFQAYSAIPEDEWPIKEVEAQYVCRVTYEEQDKIREAILKAGWTISNG